MHPYTIPQQSGYHKWSMCSDTLAAPGTQHNLSIKFAVVTKVIVLLASSTYSTMASLTILIMITGLCLANSQGKHGSNNKYYASISTKVVKCFFLYTADKCQYRYDIQPGPTINSPANSTRLILCCQVWSASNASGFSIQWHHSPTFPTAVSGADINTTIFDEDQIETKENATLKIVWSKLTLDDYKGTGDDGYYWCSVNVKDSNVSNPSTVAYVPFLNGTQTQTCNCGDGPAQNIISTQLLSTKLRCAESAISINKSDPENDICLQDDHRKPTRVEEDLMTTTPPEMDKITTADIDETNGSTPRGVTERLTTSPTTETSSGGRSTKHVATVETMTENAQYQETTTHITNSADTERLTTAESSRRDEIERIMLSFTMSKSLFIHLPKYLMLLHTALFSIQRCHYCCSTISHHLSVSHYWILCQKTLQDESKAS